MYLLPGNYTYLAQKNLPGHVATAKFTSIPRIKDATRTVISSWCQVFPTVLLQEHKLRAVTLSDAWPQFIDTFQLAHCGK